MQSADDRSDSSTRAEDQLEEAPESYEPGGGKESFHGVEYQLRMLILLLIRGIQAGHQFDLATEMKIAYNFDDVVLRLNSQSGTRCHFLQLKHRLDTSTRVTSHGLFSTKKNADFGLTVYFDSFQKMRAKFLDEEIVCVIMCTNCGYAKNDKKLKNIFEPHRCEDAVHDILQADLLRFKNNFEGRETWVQHIKDNYNGCTDTIDSDVELFLDKLAYAFNQPGVDELQKIVIEKIKQNYAVYEEDIAYSCLKREMDDWMKDPTGTFLSHTRGKDILEKLKKRFGRITYGLRSPVDNYTGREKQLRELQKAYENGSRTVVICGMGGVGKSQLARKFIELSSESFDSIIWLDAERTKNLLSSLQALAVERLHLNLMTTDGKPKNTQNLLDEIYQYFQHRKTVFVYDNAEKNYNDEDTENAIEQFLPRVSSQTLVLITSRYLRWERLKVITLDRFSEEESVIFIQKSIPEEEFDAEKSKTLAKELSYFPLALQQAVAYIRESSRYAELFGKKKGIEKYMELWKREKSTVLGRNVQGLTGDDYSSTTWTTWNVTLNKIAKKEGYGHVANDIVKLIAFYVPEGIDLRDIYIHFKDLDPETVNQAVLHLHDYSIITLNKEIAIHRLVQWSTIRKLQEMNEEKSILGRILKCCSEIDFKHTMNVWEKAISYNELVIEFKFIPQHILSKLKDNGRFAEGYKLGKRYLIKLEKVIGTSDVYYLMTLGNLASVSIGHGKYKKAKKLYERLLEAQNKQYGNHHPSITYTLYGIALVLSFQGEWGKALTLYRECLQKRKAILGEHHPETLATMHNIAGVLSNQGKREEAMSVYTECLRKRKSAIGESQPDTLATMHNIARVLADQGKLEEALSMYMECLGKRKSVIGESHPDTIATMHNIAGILSNQGKREEAMGMYQECLRKQKSVIGEGHPDTIKTMHNVAGVLADQGKHEEAMSLYTECLGRQKSVIGESHPETLTTMHNIAGVLANQGKHEEALTMYLECLRTRKYVIGESHPETLTTMHNIGAVFANQGKLEEALTLYQECLQNRKSILGEHHPETLATMHNMAVVLAEQGKHEEAISMLMECLGKQKAVIGESHPETVTTIHSIARVLADQGN